MRTASDVVQSLYSTFADGDIEAALELLDPEVEWVTPETLPWSRGRYEGREDVALYFASFAGALTEARVEPETFVTDEDRVVVLGYERATCTATGRRFDAPFAHAFRVRDGRIATMRGIVDTAMIAETFGVSAGAT